MSTLTMNMSGFEIERVDSIIDVNEAICSGWNPDTALQPYMNKRNAMPQDLLAVDVGIFLKKMYACQ